MPCAQVWEEEVTLVDMHPNPVVLERLHAAGQLAVSNERVLLSGLPVHVLVSVQIKSSEVYHTCFLQHKPIGVERSTQF